MSVAGNISNNIKRMRKAWPFSSSLFFKIGSRECVNKVLSRLAIAGTLERVTRGVYMRPKESKYIGRVRPSAKQVIEVIARKKKEVIQIHGAEAVRRLGLSTQMQVQTTYYTSGSTREIRLGNAVVRLKHVPRAWLQHAGTKVGIGLIALHYLGKVEVSGYVVSQIVKSLDREEFNTLLNCRMPAWMRAQLKHFDQ